jgi:hypothetical protein
MVFLFSSNFWFAFIQNWKRNANCIISISEKNAVTFVSHHLALFALRYLAYTRLTNSLRMFLHFKTPFHHFYKMWSDNVLEVSAEKT